MLPRVSAVLPAPDRPRLFVVIDTEEEFDWSAPYSRANVGVTAMKHVGAAQRIFDAFAVVPTYVIDYPVASQPDGFAPLLDIARDGRCAIGAHLHPWVNPPYVEDLTTRNSFTMNLPVALQRSKLEELSATIADHFGSRPQVFKAGRYGLGAATVPLLEEAGFTVDMSVCPRFDFSDQDGPDFGDFDSSAFFLTPRLLEIPCTVDYTGWAGPLRPLVHRAASSRFAQRLRAVGVASRLRVTNQIMLSPEGNTVAEMRALAQALVRRGCSTFTLSFHSPSLAVGHTPYVRTTADLQTFLASLEAFFAFFFSDLTGVPATPLEFRTELLSSPGLFQ